jgi:hypothetical protein
MHGADQKFNEPLRYSLLTWLEAVFSDQPIRGHHYLFRYHADQSVRH